MALCSSGLFCLSNITYERFGRRSLLINKGLINLMPRMAIWWFLSRACNLAVPPSLNLIGEIGLLSRLVSWSWCRIFVLVLVSFFSAPYTLCLYSYSQHGSIDYYKKSTLTVINSNGSFRRTQRIFRETRTKLHRSNAADGVAKSTMGITNFRK